MVLFSVLESKSFKGRGFEGIHLWTCSWPSFVMPLVCMINGLRTTEGNKRNRGQNPLSSGGKDIEAIANPQYIIYNNM